MERVESLTESGHVIDIATYAESSTSNTSQGRAINGLNTRQNENLPSTSARAPVLQTPLFTTNGRSAINTQVGRRSNGHGRRRSALNSGYWISFELVITLIQIVAAIVVLSLSSHEHPRAPLILWIITYASGCVLTLPLLFWRYRYRNEASEENLSQSRLVSQSPLSARAASIASSLNARTSEWDNRGTSATASRSAPTTGDLSSRFKVLVEYFKIGLDCFFAIWFVVGNVWIFGGHSSSSDAPNLYRLCIVFLTISCIGYAMPFILCVAICCCLPCIFSSFGFREDMSQSRGATTDSINALPTYKLKMKKNKTGSDREKNAVPGDIMVVTTGTEKERFISGEDAVCCICLAKYINNDELRELPCSHIFHKDCVDKWLKINASCPLCKIEVGQTLLSSLTEATANLRRNTMF